MKKLYSIGETAKIMGISVQTLRNYSNFSFLQPAFINEETGYRFYSFQQFHIIDRIKYLRSFGLSLDEIEAIMMDGKKVDKIISFLEHRELAVDKQIQELQMTKQDILWYIDYFKHLNQSNHNLLPHISHFEERYILYTDCMRDETVEDIEVRLAKIKNEHANQSGLHFLRQYGYLIDYEQIIERQWNPNRYFIYLSDMDCKIQQKMGEEKLQFMKLPAGDYLCFSFRLRHMEELNINLIKEYFEQTPVPSYVIANEHEDNLVSYEYCPYELQFFLQNYK